jgi:hypothetical protein
MTTMEASDSTAEALMAPDELLESVHSTSGAQRIRDRLAAQASPLTVATGCRH